MPAMMTRWLMALFVVVTLAGTAALTFSGCDDGGGDNPQPDLSYQDLRPAHD
jgi:hypothetical protein